MFVDSFFKWTHCLLSSFVSFRWLPGDYWGKKWCHLPQSIHKLALPGTEWQILFFWMHQILCSSFYPGWREVSCWGAFVGSPPAWGVSAEWNSDRDHRDPSLGAPCCCRMLSHIWKPSGSLWDHFSSVYTKETEPGETGKNLAASESLLQCSR